MIKGLEFLKSWRFWVWQIASTALMTLGIAGVHIASAVYFPRMADGSPDDLYPLLLGFVLVTIFVAAAWFIFMRGNLHRRYPMAYWPQLFTVVVIVATAIVVLELIAVRRFLVEPILDGVESTPLFSMYVMVVGWAFGQWAAMAEWAVMTDADRDTELAD